MLNRFHNAVLAHRLAFMGLLTALLVGGEAGVSFADSASSTAAQSAVLSASDEMTSLITAGVPVILGVALVWLAIVVGKKLIRKVG